MTDSRRPVGQVVEARVRSVKGYGEYILDRIKDGTGPSQIHIHNNELNKGEKVRVKIVSYGDSCGHLLGELVEVVSKSKEFSKSVDELTTERVEWRGTEQDLPSAEERERISFTEPRGNKNDLLNGHK